MGAKYTTIATSGYNATPPADDGSQVAANLVSWATTKTKLSDPVKTLADSMNTALVAAFNYSVRQITSSDSCVAGDHMRCVEVAPTISSSVSVTVTLADAATMTNIYRVFIKNSRADGVVTIARATGGDTIDGTAANIILPGGAGILLGTTTGADGYLIQGTTGPSNSGSTATTFTFDGSGGSSSSVTLRWERVGNIVFLQFPTITATTGTGSTVLSSDTALAAAARPSTTRTGVYAGAFNNGTVVAQPGYWDMSSGGILRFFRDPLSTAYTNSAVGGANTNQTIMYYAG